MQPLVDSHVHFWQPAQLRYDWLTSVPAINHACTPELLTQKQGDIELQQIVFVQADCVSAQGIDEAAWVSALAQTEPRLGGIVAFAPLEQGERVRGWLERLAALPLVKGVRRLLQAEPVGFARQPDFVAGVRLLAQFGYSFDICIVHPQMADAVWLAAQCPEVRFVLDHLGKPGIAAGLWEPWATEMVRLAALPNVWCKLSGLVTEADHANWQPADLQPYIDHALATFGAERLMFGGDWPVSELATTYVGWWETAVSALSHLSAADQHRIFYENGRSFYQLS
ncbi:MAG: amidohydrolase family protein [Anaerolineales bacterium]|nr:amidohydrolase family protein [Anaerolineales bacterium]